MPAEYRCRGPQWPPAPGGETFRAARGIRVLLIIAQAVIPAFFSILIWAPADGTYHLPKAASLAITAAAVASWLALGRRAWRESATVSRDVIVVRNVFRAYAVPVESVTGFWFGAGGSPLRGARHMRLAVSRPGRPGTGRHGAQQPISVAAGRLGTASWSGRRTAADELAVAIAAVTGLPAIPPRSQVVARRTAAALAAVGLAVFVVSAAASGLGHGNGVLIPACHLAGRGLAYAGALLVLPGACLAIDWLAARLGQNSRSAPSSMPRIES